MKLPLRYFLVVSILLGAAAIPVGWRSYQKWKVAEVERLETERGELWDQPLPNMAEYHVPSSVSASAGGEEGRWQPEKLSF